MTQDFDVIVIGAGAAGLFAAARAGARGRRVLVLEHNSQIGAKILISGGGRCNFTNLDIKPENFISANPHFVRSALARYTQTDFIELVRRFGIAFHEKGKGQLFCTAAGGAKQIIAMLADLCAQAGVAIKTDCRVQGVVRGALGFEVSTSLGQYRSTSVIVASGGLSIPKLGATGLAYEIARQFGIRVIPTAPALVPLVFDGAEAQWMAPLAGVSLTARATIGKTAFDDGMVFTHRGLSGPAILQISSYWQKGQSIALNLLPETGEAFDLKIAKARRPKASLTTHVSQFLPARLAQVLTARAGLDRPMADIKDAQLMAFAAVLERQVLTPIGDEGYAKAEVTRGGIDTAALSQKTMEAKAVQGLYFIGEAVDVTGWLGGYNFQWAWSSGAAAGDAA
ncbi:MAG: hypothetical protein RL186_315 [Pseudomonadota bacterium]